MVEVEYVVFVDLLVDGVDDFFGVFVVVVDWFFQYQVCWCGEGVVFGQVFVGGNVQVWWNGEVVDVFVVYQIGDCSGN